MKPTTAPEKVVDPTSLETDVDSTKETANSLKPTLSQGKNGSGIHAAVAPPPAYGGPVPSPHINNMGPPPKLDLTNFANWVFRIESHLNSSSTQLWRIIEEGYYPHDPKNLSPREEVDNQLNASALFILQASLPPEELPHIRPFKLAKDAWDHINSMYKGSSSIQRSNFEVILDEADEFAMNEDEDPRELYRRLTTLAVSLRDHGSKDTDDNWIKRKFLKAIMPFNKSMSSVIRQRPDFHTLSSSDVLDEFIAMNILNKTADNALARVQRQRSPTLL